MQTLQFSLENQKSIIHEAWKRNNKTMTHTQEQSLLQFYCENQKVYESLKRNNKTQKHTLKLRSAAFTGKTGIHHL